MHTYDSWHKEYSSSTSPVYFSLREGVHQLINRTLAEPSPSMSLKGTRLVRPFTHAIRITQPHRLYATALAGRHPSG